jgi:hypothetical protein
MRARMRWMSAPNSGAFARVILKPLYSGGLWLPVTCSPPSRPRAATA